MGYDHAIDRLFTADGAIDRRHEIPQGLVVGHLVWTTTGQTNPKAHSKKNVCHLLGAYALATAHTTGPITRLT